MTAALHLEPYATVNRLEARVRVLEMRATAVLQAQGAVDRALNAYANAAQNHKFAMARGVLTKTHAHRVENAEQDLADARFALGLAIGNLRER